MKETIIILMIGFALVCLFSITVSLIKIKVYQKVYYDKYLKFLLEISEWIKFIGKK